MELPLLCRAEGFPSGKVGSPLPLPTPADTRSALCSTQSHQPLLAHVVRRSSAAWATGHGVLASSTLACPPGRGPRRQRGPAGASEAFANCTVGGPDPCTIQSKSPNRSGRSLELRRASSGSMSATLAMRSSFAASRCSPWAVNSAKRAAGQRMQARQLSVVRAAGELRTAPTLLNSRARFTV
jgi:hypothetical protein